MIYTIKYEQRIGCDFWAVTGSKEGIETAVETIVGHHSTPTRRVARKDTDSVCHLIRFADDTHYLNETFLVKTGSAYGMILKFAMEHYDEDGAYV